MQLRYYQEEAVVSIFEYFTKKAGNPVVGLPTGTGKALVIADFIKRALRCYPKTRFMIATHRKELVDQDYRELLEIWPSAPCGIYSAGLKRKELHYPITFCGIQSAGKCPEDFGFIDLLLVDECHMISHKADTQYVKAIEALKRRNPLLKVVGFTATPYRIGLGMITEGPIFDDLCIDYTGFEKFNELLDKGYMAPLVPRKTEQELDVSGVGTHAGEFIQEDLQREVDKESITRGALAETLQHAHDRKHWMVFCAGTQHADHATQYLNEMGIPAAACHSNLMGHNVRIPPLPGESPADAALRAFKTGQVRALVGCEIFTTGFNFRPVDCIVVLRPTMSAVLWVQLLGRGTRPSPETGKKDCLVLDFAANTRRLGPINDPVIPRKKGQKKTGLVPYKICPACQTYNHTRARFCICCQHEFPQHVAVSTVAATEELIRREKPKPEEYQAPPPPVVDEYPVTRVEYAKHLSRDRTKPPSLRVSFYSGPTVFNEFLCLEHSGFARKKARDQWRLMAANGPEGHLHTDPPETVDDALARLDTVTPPRRIRVLIHSEEGKWPEVVGYDFDGPPMVPSAHDPHLKVASAEDDIPF